MHPKFWKSTFLEPPLFCFPTIRKVMTRAKMMRIVSFERWLIEGMCERHGEYVKAQSWASKKEATSRYLNVCDPQILLNIELFDTQIS